MIFKFRVVQPETAHRKPQMVLLIGRMTLTAIVLLAVLIITAATGYVHIQFKQKDRQLQLTYRQLQSREKLLSEVLNRHHDLLLQLPTEIESPSIMYASAEDYIRQYGQAAQLHIEAADLFIRGNWESCLHACRQLLAKDNIAAPTRLDVYAKAARCLHYLGRSNEAFDLLEEAINESPDDQHLRQMKADMLIMAGRFEAAYPILEELLEKSPSTGLVFSMSNVQRGMKQFTRAIDGYRYVIANGKATQLRAAANNLALLYAKDLADMNRANTYLTMLLALAPDSPNALATAGHIMLLQDRFTEAENFLTRAEKLVPDNIELLHDLITLHERTGRMNMADDYRARLKAMLQQ